MLIPSTVNMNPTITPGETKPRLVSEEHFLPGLSGPATAGLCPYATLLLVMSGEDRTTSPQSSLSQPIVDSLTTDEGIVRSWCISGSCYCHSVPIIWVIAILYLLFGFLRIIFERQGPGKGTFLILLSL